MMLHTLPCLWMGGSFKPRGFVVYGDIDVEVHVNVAESVVETS